MEGDPFMELISDDVIALSDQDENLIELLAWKEVYEKPAEIGYDLYNNLSVGARLPEPLTLSRALGPTGPRETSKKLCQLQK